MAFELNVRARLAVTEAMHAVKSDLSAQDQRAIAAIIEHAMADAVRAATQGARDIIANHFGPEMDKAHKLQDQIDRCHTALIANLSSMR